MPRVRMTIEYDGTRYSGWQRQLNAPSVQQTIEETLKRLTGEKELFIVGASRTDAGVHALGQTAHFDTESRIPPEKYAYALNALLPEDIRVCRSEQADESFHARFSARGKRYVYRIHNGPHACALTRLYACHVTYPLDLDKMAAEARAVAGTHDFKAFAASGSIVKDTVRTIYSAALEKRGDEILLTIEGSGFLYNMVRILAGTLIATGAGKLEPGAIKRALASASRLDLGVTAPAKGLTLMKVFYSEDDHTKDGE